MSELDNMIDQIEREEAEQEMYFSLYSVPFYYNDESELND